MCVSLLQYIGVMKCIFWCNISPEISILNLWSGSDTTRPEQMMFSSCLSKTTLNHAVQHLDIYLKYIQQKLELGFLQFSLLIKTSKECPLSTSILSKLLLTDIQFALHTLSFSVCMFAFQQSLENWAHVQKGLLGIKLDLWDGNPWTYDDFAFWRNFILLLYWKNSQQYN